MEVNVVVICRFANIDQLFEACGELLFKVTQATLSTNSPSRAEAELRRVVRMMTENKSVCVCRE